MATTCPIHSGNSSLARHVLRGAVALIAIVFGFYYSSTHPLLAFIAIIAAVIALGGCPGCWLAGLLFHITKSKDANNQSAR